MTSLTRLDRSPNLRQLGARRRPSTVVIVWAAAFAFIAFLVAARAYFKARMEQRLHEQIVTVTQLAADRAALIFDIGDRLLLSVIDDLDAAGFESANGLTPPQKATLQLMLARKLAHNPGIASLAVAGADGHIFAIVGATGKDREEGHSLDIGSLTFGADDQPAISPTEDSHKPTDIRSARIVRHLRAADGRNIGFVAAHMDLAQSLVDISQSVGLGENDMLALSATASTPLADYSPPATLAGDRLLNLAAAGLPNDVHFAVSAEDDVKRVLSYRRLPRYPLFLVYAKDIEDLLTVWRYETVVVVAAVLSALLASAVVTSGIRRRLTLAARLETVQGDLINSNNALRAALAASELVAAKDQLTGLWNRRAFDLRLEEAIARHGRHSGAFSLLLLDMDHFKSINDQYGHVVGDEVLKRFGSVLDERLRQNDVAARWGGEEFAVLADGASLENAMLLAEHIRIAVETRHFEGPDQITVSIGVAEYEPGETGDDLLTRADDALYEAKRTGRNRVVACTGQTLTGRAFIDIPREVSVGQAMH